MFNYRNNHINLPWSSSHRSLDSSDYPLPAGLSSNYENSRFRFYPNKLAVAWPRAPLEQEAEQDASNGPISGGGLDGTNEEEDNERMSQHSKGRTNPSRFRPRPVRGILKRKKSDTDSPSRKPAKSSNERPQDDGPSRVDEDLAIMNGASATVSLEQDGRNAEGRLSVSEMV